MAFGKARKSETRQSYRVDDVFPVKIRRIDEETAVRSVARAVPGLDALDITAFATNETINPALRKMLVEINSKLSILLDRLVYSAGDMPGRPESRAVNISATGIKVTEDKRIGLGEKCEILLYLPTTPSIEILTYGIAVRVSETCDCRHEIALRFTDMDDTVREEIIQYVLHRQREIIKKAKGISTSN